MSPLALSIRFLQTQPDAKLVELARAGHERAFEALVQRYRRQLLSYCRRISSSDAAAEDALQQGLLQAWVALSSGEIEVRDARAWLYRIVHNVAVSSLRRPVHDSVEVDRAESTGGADHEVERRLAVRQALAGLASLPDLQRQVMLSAALEGQSHDEIATALGLSHGAVRGLIYRARATLRAAAAAVTPTPLVHWAARQELASGGRSAGVYETIAGGGSAGLGGLLIKGGAVVVTAGALATATGVTTGGRHSHHAPRRAETAAARRSHGAASSLPTSFVTGPVAAVQLTAVPGRSRASQASVRGPASASRGASANRASSSGTERVISISRTGASRSRGSGGDHHGGTIHSGSGGSGSSSGTSGHDRTGGSDGGSRGGSSGGSGSTSRTDGGDHGDGGHDGAVQSIAPTTTPGSGSGSGDGSGDHQDGGGSGSGSGPTTTTVTVTSTTSTSAGGGGSGSSGGD